MISNAVFVSAEFILLFSLEEKLPPRKEGKRAGGGADPLLVAQPGKIIASASERNFTFFSLGHLLIFGLLIYSLHGFLVMSRWPQCIPNQQRCCDKIDNVSECHILYIQVVQAPIPWVSLGNSIISDENVFR